MPSTSTGPGTDLTVGLLPESRWQGVESETADRAPLRREHADGGGLHDTRLASDGRSRPLDSAARPLRPDRARPRGAVRERPHRRRLGRGGRGRDPRPADDRRQRRPARRGRARRRDVTHRRRPGSRSSRRCSTRTRPATSPTGARTRRLSKASPAKASTSPRCTPTSWSAGRRSTSTRFSGRNGRAAAASRRLAARAVSGRAALPGLGYSGNCSG